MLKNFKYYAGLADADAYTGLSFCKSTDGSYNVYATIKYAFRWDTADKVLPALCEEYDVTPFRRKPKEGDYQQSVQLTGKKAVRLMEQIKKHSILKRQLMEWLISMNGKNLTKEELPGVRAKLKSLRADKTLSKKDYPSRQWTAGYIDGDGCFASMYDKKHGGLVFRVMITSHRDDPQGVLLMQKAYGGNVYVRKDGNLCYTFSLADKDSAEKFFSGVLPHIRVKRAQADFILSVLRKGRHLKKNGATPESNLELHNKLKELKKANRPQRLSETTPEGEATV